MTPLFPFGPGAASGYGGLFALVALALMGAEYLFHTLNHEESHDGGETAASLLVGLGNKAIAALTAGLATVPVLFIHEHRAFDIPLDGPLAWLALFLGVELAYYVHHLAMHKVRWLWASHSVHHSPTRLNLTAAVRLGWGGHLTGGLLFYLPLVALGFHPAAVFGVLGLGLGYQFLLHLAHPPHLGPLEWVLNTPRHHQVHHASNPACLDRNFGGVLIVFDRLFGTFAAAPRDEPLRFGLVGAGPTRRPLRIVFGVWTEMLGDARKARGTRAKLRALFGPPT